MKPSTTENRKPYAGLTRSLVIAIDVGTTFSGVSYAILEPGEIPKIHGVTRFPGQEHVAGNSKIPTVIYYDKQGKLVAAGAEADTATVVSNAEDEGWTKTELFKLRLRPRSMQLNMNGMRLGPLPRKKTAVHVFGDFLAYMYRCTRNFIIDTHGNGAALWNAVEHDIQFVLSHPNGWEGAQQTKMRRAAVYGGLIPDTNEGKARIRFVTEGEASLHACVLNGLAADVLSNPSKHGFLIADAGGGTLDISAYAIRHTSPLLMEEIAPSDCIFAGSVFVSRRAREFLEEKLKGSRYGTPAAVDHITQRFDETTKRLFRDRKEPQYIPFGSPLDKDPLIGVRLGQLKLTGNEVANLFEPSIDAAFNALKAQIEVANGLIRSVFLVGGYAASPWLFSQLQERLAPYKITISRPDTQTSKAVADGAVGFYCDHHVSARMSKFMYGVEFLRELDPKNPDHVARRERLCELPSGPKLLPDAFDCILSRGVKVKESTVFTRKYCTELTSLTMLSVFEVEIWCYRGGNVIPKWIDRQSDAFSTLCVVRADLSPLSGSAEPKTGRGGKTYWTIVFSIEIHFGLTEFRARIKWIDEGKTKYGPASIIYNERGHRSEEEEPDAFPEDDVGTPRNRPKSEPPSRALSPMQEVHAALEEEAPPPQEEPLVEIPREIPRAQTPTPPPPPPAESEPEPKPEPPASPPVVETPKKKGKGKQGKNGPKIETNPASLNTFDKTPKLGDSLSAAWGSVEPAGDLLSPMTPAVPQPPQTNSPSSAKDNQRSSLFGSASAKPSPNLAASKSPLGATDPIVAPVVVEEPPPVVETPAPEPEPEPVSPVVEKAKGKGKGKGKDVPKTPVPPTPVVEKADEGFQDTTPAGKKGKKKKGGAASAAATPAVQPAPVTPEPPPPVEEPKPKTPEPEPQKEPDPEPQPEPPKEPDPETQPEPQKVPDPEAEPAPAPAPAPEKIEHPLRSTKVEPAALPDAAADAGITDTSGGLLGPGTAASALLANSEVRGDMGDVDKNKEDNLFDNAWETPAESKIEPAAPAKTATPPPPEPQPAATAEHAPALAPELTPAPTPAPAPDPEPPKQEPPKPEPPKQVAKSSGWGWFSSKPAAPKVPEPTLTPAKPAALAWGATKAKTEPPKEETENGIELKETTPATEVERGKEAEKPTEGATPAATETATDNAPAEVTPAQAADAGDGDKDKAEDKAATAEAEAPAEVPAKDENAEGEQTAEEPPKEDATETKEDEEEVNDSKRKPGTGGGAGKGRKKKKR